MSTMRGSDTGLEMSPVEARDQAQGFCQRLEGILPKTLELFNLHFPAQNGITSWYSRMEAEAWPGGTFQ